MADKVDKPKKQKPKAKKDEKGVLAGLPATRPERIGSRRATARTATAAATEAPAPKTTTSTRASKAAAKGKSKASAPKRTTAAKPASARTSATRARTAARPEPTAPRTFEPTEAAAAAARPAFSGPQSVREGAPGIGTSPPREEPAAESGRPGGVELAATALKAAAEVAQLGVAIGGQVLRRVAGKLPRP